MPATPSPQHETIDDLSALAWVQEELRRSLESAHKSLRRHLRDAEAVLGSDLDSVDPNLMRSARAQLHQGVGALELVGLPAAAQLLRAAENAVARAMGKGRRLDAAAVEAVESGSFALLDYLQRMLAGKPLSPVSMFPQYRKLQELAGADRIHPADVWVHDWRWREIDPDPQAQARPLSAEIRGEVETQTLALMRDPAGAAAGTLSDLFAGLGASAADARLATFWKLAAAFFQAQQRGLLRPDTYSKRMASRLLAVLRIGEQGVLDASDRLAQDLLFFCAQSASPGDGRAAPRLAAVRRVYGLTQSVPVDYESARLGRFNPAWVVQAHKRVGAAKDVWAAVAGGELLRLPGMTEQFALVGDSIGKLFPSGTELSIALQRAAAQTVQSQAEPRPELAMEVATALLYLEATLDEADFEHPQQPQRVRRLADRLAAVAAGDPAQPLEDWMEDLYRRVSDRQTLGSVVQELRATLAEIEKAIDLYFREPARRELLVPVPAQLQSMRGVLSVLGLDDASAAVLQMSDEVDALAQRAPAGDAAAAFEHLAANMGTLGFLIDMLSVQPQMAKTLFRHDVQAGRLHSVVGGGAARATALGALVDENLAPVAIAPRLVEQAQAIAFHAARPDIPTDQVASELERLSQEAEAADQSVLAGTVREAQQALRSAPDATAAQAAREDVAHSMAEFVASTTGALAPLFDDAPPQPVPPAPALPPRPGMTGLEDDPEMRAIFLDEAREVAGEAAAALDQLDAVADDLAALTTVRRAFHTLKGSSRMVGLAAFGDAAWSCEQLYNARLAEAAPADAELTGLTRDVLAYLSDWLEAIERHERAGVHDANAVAQAADAMRLARRRDPLPLPGGTLTLRMPTEHGLLAAPMPAAPKGAVPSVAAPTAAASPLSERVPGLPSRSDLDLVDPLDPGRPLPPAPATAPPTEAAPALDFVLDLSGLDSRFDTRSASRFDSSLDRRPDSHAGSSDSAPATPSPAFEPAEASAGAAAPAGAPATAADTAHDAFTAVIGHLSLDLPSSQPMPLAASPSVAWAAPAETAAASAEDAPVTEPIAADMPFVDDAPRTDVPPPEERPVAEEAPRAGEDPVAEPAPRAESVDSAARDAWSEPPRVAGAPSDELRQVGPLSVSLPLFNVFLNEADEWSRRLGVELAEWGCELERPVGASAVALAHSLAGSSATVGFAELSRLARALEHGLARSQRLGAGVAHEVQAFEDAAREIVRLLHQFAAGFLRSPDEALFDRLDAIEREQALRLQATQAQPSASVAAAFDDSSARGAFHDTPAGASFDDSAADATPSAPAPRSSRFGALAGAASEARPSVLGALDPLDSDYRNLDEVDVPVAAQASADALDSDDDIDAEDALDAELWPFFADEGHELLPELAAGLRAWTAQPTDEALAAACLRALHTIKGGARLAGAMRLGEMAHRLETAIELRLARGAQAVEIEALQARADALAEHFDALRALATEVSESAPSARPAPAAALQPAAAPSTPAAFATTDPAPAAPKVDTTLGAPIGAEPEPARAEGPRTEAGTTLLTTLGAVDDADWLAHATRFAAPAPTPTADPLPRPEPAESRAARAIDWSRWIDDRAAPADAVAATARTGTAVRAPTVRVRAPLLDRLVNEAGEVSIGRARIEAEVGQLKGALVDLGDNLERLRHQLRDLELQAETQVASRVEAERVVGQAFDPLEMDRFTRLQELTRMMAESVNDIATVQRSLQRSLASAEDELAAQARLARDMQDDLLRTRMVEFDGLADRLYRVVRQAGKETGKLVRLDLVGGHVEVDRGVLERMTGAFEHLVRNCVTHGIEAPDVRTARGKDAHGQITVALTHEGNEIGVEVRDDGAGLDLARIRARAVGMGLLAPDASPSDGELSQLIFVPGMTTADSVTELAGRGIGMDVVRNDVLAMGGRIETASAPGRGTRFRLVLPLTTAVTQVVMVRAGALTLALPSVLVERVRLADAAEVAAACVSGRIDHDGAALPFFWLGALLETSARSGEDARKPPLLIVRSAQQRIALQVDEVIANQEVVIKHLGAQLSRLPGLAGVTLLASGRPALIYNPVALAALHGERAWDAMRAAAELAGRGDTTLATEAQPEAVRAPLVLVVDDSLTVRRVTQRLLEREGYRVTLAKDGIDGLAKLADERPAVLLTDIEMPRMDGFDLVRSVRADPRLADLPVVMITSRIAQKHRDVAAALGVRHYLGKPYAEEELLALVARHATPPVPA